MKIKSLLLTSLVVSTFLVILTSAGPGGTHDNPLNAGGTSTSTGAPGEPHTCSQAGCHGAGNGNSSHGGLPDNGGPGSITFSSVPAMVGNQYVPNTTYHINITVAETGQLIFGFNAEMLDNSGNTNTQIDNTLGTLTITDPVHTHIMHGWGTGRSTVTHMLNGGLTNDTHTFTFDWTAPATGIVNAYYSGVAGNNDNLCSAADNVYVGYTQLTPLNTGIASTNDALSLEVYPNPASDNLHVDFSLTEDAHVAAEIFSMDGRKIKTLEDRNAMAGSFTGNYDITDLSSGIYILKITSGTQTSTKRIVVQ